MLSPFGYCGWVLLVVLQPADGAAQNNQPIVPVLSRHDFPPDIVSEEDYEAWLGERSQGLAAAAGQFQSRTDRAGAELAAANFILAQQLEPILSRRLLNLTKPEDAARAAELAKKASTHLDAARRELDPSIGDNPVGASDDHAKLLAQLEIISAFTQAAGTLYPLAESEPGESERQQAYRRAASDLAVVAEDAGPELAAACALWQGLLLNQGGLPDRLSTVLPEVLSNPRCPNCTWPFFARLLRCGLLCQGEKAPSDGCIAAEVLAIRLQEAADEWFPDETRKAEAGRAVAWMRLGWLRRWQEAVGADARGPETDWFDRKRDRIDQEYFSVQPASLLRLGAAMPMLVTARDAETSTQAAGDAAEPVNGDSKQ